MGTGTYLELPRRTRCFDGNAQRGPVAQHCLLSHSSAERKRKNGYWWGSRDVRVGEPLKLPLKKGGVPADLRR